MSEQNTSENNAYVVRQVEPTNECISVDKIYDWVTIETNQIQEIPIPPTQLVPIEAALDDGHQLLITGNIDLPDGVDSSIVSIVRKIIIIDGQPVEVGCTQILKTVTINVNVYDITVGGIEPIATFSSTFQILERAGLCFPEPFTSDNIILNVLNAQALSLSAVPVNGNLVFEIGICQELQVLTRVSLEILARFCEPRDNTIDCGNSIFGCSVPAFPTQCPIIFPGS